MTVKDPRDAVHRLIDLGHISGGVGHHVINAFSAVVSNAELLRLEPPMPALADPVAIANTIIQTALEASTVARRLIDYTRPVTSTEPDRAAFALGSVDLKALVEEVVEAEKARSEPGVRWETDLQPLAPIKGHETQLRSMLDYLFVNCREAFPDGGGTIRLVGTTDNRGWINLEVADNGVGMEQATLVRAVEPFYSTKPGHVGVGLSIANGIWRRHRGTLSVQSRPGEGTTIRLCVEPSRD